MELPPKVNSSSHRVDTLDLSHYALTAIPESVYSLTGLTSLRLDNNAIQEVNWAALLAMTNLQTLDLSYNFISSFPAMLSTWNTIQLLNLTSNRIADFPASCWTLLRGSEYIIPLTYAPLQLDLHCPKESQKVFRKFGRKLPRTFEHTWSTKIEYFDGYEYVSVTHIVKVGEPYWRRADQSPRVRLDLTPVVKSQPRLVDDFISFSHELELREIQELAQEETRERAVHKHEQDVRTADRRENRHQRRVGAKARHRARDSKHLP